MSIVGLALATEMHEIIFFILYTWAAAFVVSHYGFLKVTNLYFDIY